MAANSYRLIQENPYRPGPAEAVLVEYDIPVWAIIGHLKAIHWDKQLTAQDYDISDDSVNEAVRYYQHHIAAIDARLQANMPPSITHVFADSLATPLPNSFLSFDNPPPSVQLFADVIPQSYFRVGVNSEARRHTRAVQGQLHVPPIRPSETITLTWLLRGAPEKRGSALLPAVTVTRGSVGHTTVAVTSMPTTVPYGRNWSREGKFAIIIERAPAAIREAFA